MTETSADGQDALRLLSRAARALLEEGALTTEGLLPAWRLLAPWSHEGAAHDVVDVATLARLRSMGGDALLAATEIGVDVASPRARVRFSGGLLRGARDSVVGDAFGIAMSLSLEAAKLAHGLPVPDDALRAAFATPTDAARALDALRAGGVLRSVDAAPFLNAAPSRVDAARLAALADARPTYVIVGAGARRVHDLLSPFARRLRGELAALGAHARGEEVYAGIAALFDADDERATVDDERATVEVKDGFEHCGPGVVAARCEHINEGEVDPRVREAAAFLKRGRALLVLCEERASSLRLVLDAAAASTRAVVCIVEASDTCTPTFVIESASDLVTPLDNALLQDGAQAPSTLSLPSFMLRSASTHGVVVDDALFPLTQDVLRARVRGVLSGDAKVGVKTVRPSDVSTLSLCCIDLIGRLGPSQGSKSDPVMVKRPRR